MTGRDRLIVALDATTLEEAVAVARRLTGLVRTVKIGSALFTACGPRAVHRLRALGFEVMLDLKFFDIPSTVEESCRSAARHGISMLTVHAAGQRQMLEAAVRGARRGAREARERRPMVLAVTVLTSVGTRRHRAMTESVVALAADARAAGCDGVVASSQEAAAVRRRFGRRLRIVCPGIRPAGARADDQRRLASPLEALRRGADFLVIGRPITAARNPRAAAQAVLNDMDREARHAC
jgi:orotidine-5'-phosphate decarboxylase